MPLTVSLLKTALAEENDALHTAQAGLKQRQTKNHTDCHRKKELEAQRTEQENFEIVNLVRSMCMSRDELMNFLRGGANDAPPVETAYHEQEDMTDDEE